MAAALIILDRSDHATVKETSLLGSSTRFSGGVTIVEGSAKKYLDVFLLSFIVTKLWLVKSNSGS